MKIQDGFIASLFFMGLLFLSNGLSSLRSALLFDGLESYVVAVNWGTPLVFFLSIIFGIGWWSEAVFENLVLYKGRKIAIIALLVIYLITASVAFGSTVIIPLSFLQYAITASWYFLMSGFLIRFSVMSPDVITKLRKTD